MQPLSQDLRDRVIAALEAGDATHEQIAQRFQVSLRWVQKIWARFRATGSSAALPHGGGPTPKLTESHKQRLGELVAEQPDATLAELRERSAAPVSRGRLSQVLGKLGLVRKKKAFVPPNRTARTCAKPASSGGRNIKARRT